ncbi:hypothetical protein NQ318_003079, partial [Aromia moschata]
YDLQNYRSVVLTYEVWLLNNRTDDAATSALRACRDKLRTELGLVIFSRTELAVQASGRKCTGMNVYQAHKFLNSLKGLKRDVKRPKTIRVPDGFQRQKRTKTLKNLVNESAKIVV